MIKKITNMGKNFYSKIGLMLYNKYYRRIYLFLIFF